MNYPHNIWSVADTHPDFADNPHIAGVEVFGGIHLLNAAGDELDPLALNQADNLVTVLAGAQGKCFIYSLTNGTDMSGRQISRCNHISSS